MSARENLRRAIQDYIYEADRMSMSGDLVDRLREVDQEIAAKPDPMRQGPGSVPETKPGGSGERERPQWPSKALAQLAMTQGRES